MNHSLQQTVHGVVRRARRLLLLRGAALALAAAVGGALLWGAVDYAFRLEDHGLRTIGSLAVATLIVWAIARFLVPVVGRPLDEIDVARRIERRWPQLRDRLSSSLQFLRQSEHDSTAGSPALRRAVVAQAAGQIEQLNLREVIDPRRTWRSVIGAGLVVAAAVVTCVLVPQVASHAAWRMVAPWGDAVWPRANRLQLVDPPARIATGSDLELLVKDANGRLPSQVTLHLWFDGDDDGDVQLRDMKPLGEQLVCRLSGVTRPLRVRAVGGDDDTMPWHAIEVVPPPRVASLAVRLHPPDYTGWSAAGTSSDFAALVGTRVALRAAVDRPVASARLRQEDDEPDEAVPLDVAADGLSFQLRADAERPWIVRNSGAYWIELTDPQGLIGGPDRRWELRAMPDRAPTISLRSPQGDMAVTTGAVVPIEAMIEDDLRIERVELRWQLGQDGASQTRELYRNTTRPTDEADRAADPDRSADRQELRERWELASLALQVGGSVSFQIVAHDYAGQHTETPPQRLTIISPTGLQERLGQHQTSILGQLMAALKLQRETRSSAATLEIHLEQNGRLDKLQWDQLRSTQLRQRTVGQQLADPQQGVAGQIDRLLGQLADNRVDAAELEQRMRQLAAAIEQLAAEHLPVAEQQLTAALKLAQTGDDDWPAVATALTAAGEHQDLTITELQRLVDLLSKWDRYQRLGRQLGRLRADQQELAAVTDRWRLDLLAHDPDSVEPRQQAELAQLGSRQLELARRLDKIQSDMQQTRDQAADDDPMAATTLSDALDTLQQTAVAGRMRTAAGDVRQRQLGRAVGQQQQAIDDLAQVLDVLANRSEHRAARLLEQLREADAQLKDLKQRAKHLREQADAAAEANDPQQRRRQLERLAREHEQLAEEIERLSRRLRRLQAQRASKSLASAAARLQSACQACRQNDAAKSRAQSRLAEEDLERADQQLAERTRQAEIDLLNEQLARLEQTVAGLRSQQQGLLDETLRLDTLRGEQDQLRRSQLVSLSDLAAQQAELAEQVDHLAQDVARAEAFRLALHGARDDMRRAAERLQARQTSEAAQQPQRNAVARLDLILASLAADDDPQADQGGGGSGGAGGDGQQELHGLSELKLVLLLQQEINDRVEQIERQRDAGGALDADRQQQLGRLAEQQGQLAQLLLDLSEPPSQQPLDDPESLPEIDDNPAEEDLDALLQQSLDEE